ncbi:peptidase domain-containing ABC transporter [Chitinophaga polysaccharea]|uniref:peptidase domain-containing ABC transporter n=1 Tax=Chitinophaga polysaccharea TaxID=1293035 RepID=UPI00115A238E|nr:peptidase domain-containing ABC transporter [Chitinophaga polysaccharea]
MPKKFQFYKQLDTHDCGPTCLRMIAKHYGKAITREALREKTHIGRDGATFGGLADAAEAIGMQSLALSADFEMLSNDIPLPCIAFWRQRHFIVIVEIRKDKIEVADPGFGLITYTHQEFLNGWLPNKDREGAVLVLEPLPGYEDDHSLAERSDKKREFTGTLLAYVKPHRRLLFQLFAGLLLGTAIQLVFPFLTQLIVDKGINYNDINVINLILVAQLVLFIARYSVEVIRARILLFITGRMNLKLLSNFLMKVMRLKISFFESKNIGDLLQRIQDNNRIQNFLSSTTISILFSLINIVIYGIVLCIYNVYIFLVFLLASILNVLWIRLFMKKRAILDYKRFDQSSYNSTTIIQMLNGMQEIKLNGSEKRRRWEWEAIQARLFRLSEKSLSLSQAQDVGSSFIIQLMNIIITFIAAKAVLNGDISLGALLSVQFMVGQLNAPISGLIGFIQSWQDSKLSFERLDEIFTMPDEEHNSEIVIKDRLPENKTISFHAVGFQYGSSSSPWVLRDINMTVPNQKVTAIVGASGSGKTTLLKMLLKFFDPTTGNIQLGENDLRKYGNKLLRSYCGVVMQDGFLFADTIAKNISESDSEADIDYGRMKNAARIANILELIDGLPLGFNTKIGRSGMSLSGGQVQRILIARAVYKDPDYIFFDEATSALDANNEKVIIDNLQQFFQGKTVVVVAHRLSTVKNADNIIVLENGVIVEQGQHSDLIRQKGYYFNLVKNQLELGN